MTPGDEVEIDLSDVESEPEPIDWESIDFEEPEELIAPLAATFTTWGELDGAALLRGDLDEPEPEFLVRTDGCALLYRGKVSSIAGEPESGKGWFALHAATDVIRQGHHVVYVDFEDSPKSVFGRLRNLGVPGNLIAEKFHYVRPEQKLVYKGDSNNTTWQEFLAVLRRSVDAQGGLGLIVFDGITEALTTQGIGPNDNDHVSSWFGEVPRRLAHKTNAAVLLVDHVTKSADSRGRYAIGAGAKLAALDGSQFTMEMRLAFARGRSGLARIYVTKDRPGHVRTIAAGTSHMQAVADLVITASEEKLGDLTLTLTPPDLQINDDGSAKPTNVQQAIVSYLRKRKGQSRGRQVILDAVRGRAQVKRQAFNEMVDEGWLVEVKNGRKTEFKLGTPKDATGASSD